MRGLCKNSKIDVYYTLLVLRDNATLYERRLLGFKQTNMTFSPEQERWNIVNLVDGKVLAFTNSSHDFPFGSHRWFFTDSSCSDPGQPWRTLNLQQKVKQPGKFCCDDGYCIDSEKRCDGNNHCQDRSDENMCKTVQVPPTYNLMSPPLRKEISGVEVTFHPLEIYAHVEIQDILNIDERSSVFSLEFSISFTWSDYRLVYNFLKSDVEKNTVPSAIWTPTLTFLVQNDRTKSIEEDRHTIIEKLGPANMDAGMEYLHANESYTGSDNPITMKIRYQGTFFCSFPKIKHYPFDTEKCSVGLYLSGEMKKNVKLTPSSPVGYFGPSSVGQYSVKRWAIETTSLKEGINGVKVTVELNRDLYSIIMITYLPTIVMNLVNQATNYTKNNFDLVMTVNITCMMVLASIYVSVSSSLPLTAAMKVIDSWLLFNLFYPAMVITVNIFIQVNGHHL